MATIDVYYITFLFSFRGTVIKQDMSKEFAFLLNTCPSIKSLKYVCCDFLNYALLSCFSIVSQNVL